MWSLLSGERQASRLRAAAGAQRGIRRQPAVSERELLLKGSCLMNRVFLLLLLALLVVSPSFAQTPGPNDEARLLALVREVQTQQAQLAANQAKIEEKLATVTETVRTARIYTKRER